MSEENKAIVGRWFTEFWGNPWNPSVVDELASPDIRFEYSMHAPRRGREGAALGLAVGQCRLGELVGTALHDGAVEEAARCRHRHERLHFAAAARLTEDRHIARVAAELRDVVAHPLQGREHVERARIPHLHAKVAIQDHDGGAEAGEDRL